MKAIQLANKASDMAMQNRIDITKMAATAAGCALSGGLIVAIIQYLMTLH